MSLISLLPQRTAAGVAGNHEWLRVRRFEPERAGTVLVLVVSALILALLFKLTPDSVLHDQILTPSDEIHSIFG